MIRQPQLPFSAISSGMDIVTTTREARKGEAMRMVNTRVPDTSSTHNIKRRSTVEYKLSRISSIIEASGENVKSIPLASELQLSPDEMEEVIRAFKDVEVPVLDECIVVADWLHSLRSSERFNSVLKPFLLILGSPVTHTNVCNIKQIAHPRYSIASSVIMLAAREAQDIPYSYWYNTITAGKHGKLAYNRLFFNSFAKVLEGVDIESYDRLIITPVDRDMLVKNANPRGWYLNKFEGEGLDIAAKWHYYLKHMKLGTWIFHESVRDENSMIFHPSDWDYVPEKTEQQTTKQYIDDLMI